jgi:hypothetical protein
MSTISLVYVSFASHDLTDDELRDILRVARTTNQKLDITGMLLYRDGFFIQALEGDKEKVEPLYDKIKNDPRHKNVTLVYSLPIETRSFHNWSMGFNKISHASAANLPGFIDFLDGSRDVSFFADHPSRATLLLQEFKDQIFF